MLADVFISSVYLLGCCPSFKTRFFFVYGSVYALLASISFRTFLGFFACTIFYVALHHIHTIPENLPGNIVFLRRARHAAYTLSENDKY